MIVFGDFGNLCQKDAYPQTRLMSAHVVQSSLDILAVVLPSTFLFNARLCGKKPLLYRRTDQFWDAKGNTQGYREIHRGTRGYTCIQMYPCVP